MNLGLVLRRTVGMRVALMVPDLNPNGDAVGNDVMGMYRVLSAQGYRVRIYVRKPNHPRSIPLWSYDELRPKQGDCLIYHYATADDTGLEILKATPAQVFLRYHNVTPPHFFEGHSPEYADATRAGRAAVRLLTGVPRLSLMPASSFSAAELLQEGLHGRPLHVVPPFHRAEELLDAAIAGSAVDHSDTAFNLLAVGRIAPHKGLECLLESVGSAGKRSGRPVRLTVVGAVDPRLAAYWRKLLSLVEALHMGQQVRFLEQVPQSVLGRCYRAADLVLTASEHEGFWVPGVEAMAFGKPIVALSRTAVPETCAEAAYLCDGSAAMGEAIGQLLADSGARAELGRRARLRYEKEFAPPIIAAKFLAALEPSVRPWEGRLRALLRRGPQLVDS
jgi:glycosyltransferase involved in cell wall biosynthesis